MLCIQVMYVVTFTTFKYLLCFVINDALREHMLQHLQEFSIIIHYISTEIQTSLYSNGICYLLTRRVLRLMPNVNIIARTHQWSPYKGLEQINLTNSSDVGHVSWLTRISNSKIIRPDQANNRSYRSNPAVSFLLFRKFTTYICEMQK